MRASSQPDFWDVRYEREEHLFGTGPNAFIASQAERIPRGADVVELGAGEGRNLMHLAATRNCRGTAVDFASTALQQAKALADEHNVALETLQADLRTWQPDRRWDAVLVTFVQVLEPEQPDLFRLMQQAVRPGGWVLGTWFRPDHLEGEYARIGPSAVDRMVSVQALRHHFDDFTIATCEAVDTTLAEGPRLRGPAAVVHFAAQAPFNNDATPRSSGS